MPLRRVRRRVSEPKEEDDSIAIYDVKPDLHPSSPSSDNKLSDETVRKRAISDLSDYYGDLADSDAEDDDDDSDDSDIDDFVEDDLGGGDAVSVLTNSTHSLSPRQMMSLLVEDVVAKLCGARTKQLDARLVRFASEPRAMAEGMMTALWKDHTLSKMIQECTSAQVALVGMDEECCADSDESCEMADRCHLCHHLFPETAEFTHRLVLRGKSSGVSPMHDSAQWQQLMENASDDDAIRHWCSLGKCCAKTACICHKALHWYEHMCARVAADFAEVDDPSLETEDRIAMVLDFTNAVDRELGKHGRAKTGAEETRHLRTDGKEQKPWTWTGKTRCFT